MNMQNYVETYLVSIRNFARIVAVPQLEPCHPNCRLFVCNTQWLGSMAHSMLGILAQRPKRYILKYYTLNFPLKGTHDSGMPLFGALCQRPPFSTHPPIEERVARLVGSRPHGRDFSGNSSQENNNAHSDGATMDVQSRSFWDNMS